MERIDFVLPWVDGDDPAWLATKHQYEGADAAPRAGGEQNADCRYRDYGLLKYWFRAVERFAPWFGNVFFVTCGQKPDWLDDSNPRLRLVNHTDYIPSEYLPTFHSNTIELNLFRIADLSERFVLFNDDMFFLRPVQPTHFFRGGLPVLSCDLGIPMWLGCSTASRVVINNCGILKRGLDVNGLVRKNIRKFVDVRALGLARAVKNILSFAVNRTVIPGTFGHLPYPHLKSTFEEIWRVQPEVMDRSSRSRFRIDNGVNHWLACAWNMVSGRFQPVNEKRYGQSLMLDEGSLDEICGLIKRQACPMICMNDTERNADPERCFAAVAAAFESILPEKSSFEK